MASPKHTRAGMKGLGLVCSFAKYSLSGRYLFYPGSQGRSHKSQQTLGSSSVSALSPRGTGAPLTVKVATLPIGDVLPSETMLPKVTLNFSGLVEMDGLGALALKMPPRVEANSPSSTAIHHYVWE